MKMNDKELLDNTLDRVEYTGHALVKKSDEESTLIHGTIIGVVRGVTGEIESYKLSCENIAQVKATGIIIAEPTVVNIPVAIFNTEFITTVAYEHVFDNIVGICRAMPAIPLGNSFQFVEKSVAATFDIRRSSLSSPYKVVVTSMYVLADNSIQPVSGYLKHSISADTSRLCDANLNPKPVRKVKVKVANAEEEIAATAPRKERTKFR